MYGWSETEAKVFAAHSSRMIYIPSTNSSTWKVHHFQEDFWESTSFRQQGSGDRAREGKKGEENLFLRHVSLICSPAANKNYDPKSGLFFPPSWLCIWSNKPHSWSHRLNKCNFYNIMRQRRLTGHIALILISLIKLQDSSHPWISVDVLTSGQGSTQEVHVFITCIWCGCDSVIAKNY